MLNAKHPANHHVPTSCASTNGFARWALPWWYWIAKIWRGYWGKISPSIGINAFSVGEQLAVSVESVAVADIHYFAAAMAGG
ncbi:hypothetical protein D3C87_1923940 [compost metagenome]